MEKVNRKVLYVSLLFLLGYGQGIKCSTHDASENMASFDKSM